MKLISAQELAKILGVNETTVRKNAAKGTYPFRTVRVGSLWKFADEEVYEYVYGSKWREIAKEQGLFDENTDNTSGGTKEV